MPTTNNLRKPLPLTRITGDLQERWQDVRSILIQNPKIDLHQTAEEMEESVEELLEYATDLQFIYDQFAHQLADHALQYELGDEG